MTTKRYGIDIGTYTLVCATMNEKDEFEFKQEINAFYQLPLDNAFMVNMLQQTGVPMVEVGEFAYVLGEKALDLAISMGQEYRRPMKNGILSQNEKDAFNILAVLIRSIIGNLEAENNIVYYSIPAAAINSETNIDYHTKVLQSILDKYKDGNKTIKAYPLNEAQAISYAELVNEQFTGICISCGAGMVNCCYTVFGVPVVKFSVTNSGDYIDQEAARHCGETIAYINQAKKAIDLSVEPKNSVDRAIAYHYEIMIEHALKGIKEGIVKAGTKANANKPVPIVVAGGTASPKGFIEFFRKCFDKSPFPIEISEIRLAKENLLTVARGLYVASAMHKID